MPRRDLDVNPRATLGSAVAVAIPTGRRRTAVFTAEQLVTAEQVRLDNALPQAMRDRCWACGKAIQVMAYKGTGSCSARCKSTPVPF